MKREFRRRRVATLLVTLLVLEVVLRLILGNYASSTLRAPDEPCRLNSGMEVSYTRMNLIPDTARSNCPVRRAAMPRSYACIDSSCCEFSCAKAVVTKLKEKIPIMQCKRTWPKLAMSGFR